VAHGLTQMASPFKAQHFVIFVTAGRQMKKSSLHLGSVVSPYDRSFPFLQYSVTRRQHILDEAGIYFETSGLI
jgi:hypothetical protein